LSQFPHKLGRAGGGKNMHNVYTKFLRPVADIKGEGGGGGGGAHCLTPLFFYGKENGERRKRRKKLREK
jgi:hypothetical protein